MCGAYTVYCWNNIDKYYALYPRMKEVDGMRQCERCVKYAKG